MKPLPKKKKIKKSFKSSNKQEIIKHIQSMQPSIKEFQLVYSQEQSSSQSQSQMQFSQMCKDQSIRISKYEATVRSTQYYRQGQVTLNKKLNKLRTWRLKMCSISLSAFFGICQVSKQLKIGYTYGLYSQGYGPNKQITGFQFQNDTWIKLTYNPEKKQLILFNESTKKTFKIQIPPSGEDFDYYPYVFLYKSTVYLQYQPDFDDYYEYPEPEPEPEPELEPEPEPQSEPKPEHQLEPQPELEQNLENNNEKQQN